MLKIINIFDINDIHPLESISVDITVGLRLVFIENLKYIGLYFTSLYARKSMVHVKLL